MTRQRASHPPTRPALPGYLHGRPVARRRPSHLPRLVALCIIGFSFAIPFVWMISASLKTRVEAERADFVDLRHANLTNYPIVLGLMDDPVEGKPLEMRFARWYFNSIFIAFTITLLQVLTSAMAAYAFSRLRWRGRDTVFLLYLATIMIPGVVTMIPSFQIMVGLRFINTYHGLILPAAFSAFGTFLLRQFMVSLPQSFDEAAMLDGAGHWRIFWDIIVPLARPGMIALAIITFLGAYQSFFWPLIMLNDADLYTLPVGMLALDNTYGRQTELIMAATVMNIVPLIVLFVIFQKFLVKGLVLGGVKG